MKNFALNIASAAILLAAMTGCSTPSINAPVMPAATAAEQSITMLATLAITDPAGYSLQAVDPLKAWNKGDVKNVMLTLYKKDADGTYVATGATKNVVFADLAAAVTLNNLRMASDYKVIATAFNSSDTRIDNSTEANNSVIFTTPSLQANATGDTIDDAARTITIPVRLKNKDFAGQATSTGVTVNNGTIINTTDAESF